jgi:hypothetical protein
VANEMVMKGKSLKSSFIESIREKRRFTPIYDPKMSRKPHREYLIKNENKPVMNKELTNIEGMVCLQVKMPPTFCATKGLK